MLSLCSSSKVTKSNVWVFSNAGVYPWKCTRPRTPFHATVPKPRRLFHYHAALLPPPETNALLFLRFGFGGPPVPGVFGLSLLLLPFLAGGISVFNAGGVGVALLANDRGPLAPAAGTASLPASFLPVDERWNSPGWPVIGFSSIYSSPYFKVMSRVCSRSRLLRYVLLFDVVIDFLDCNESGRGVFSLLVCPSCDSADLRRLVVVGGM
jgi:hypothetical protein